MINTGLADIIDLQVSTRTFATMIKSVDGPMFSCVATCAVTSVKTLLAAYDLLVAYLASVTIDRVIVGKAGKAFVLFDVALKAWNRTWKTGAINRIINLVAMAKLINYKRAFVGFESYKVAAIR